MSTNTSSMPVEEEENREPFTDVLDQDSATWTPVREEDPDFLLLLAFPKGPKDLILMYLGYR